jgi:hypothetical protein
MIFPYVKKKQPPAEEMNSRIQAVGLDPSIRTFQAGYDSSGKFIDYGTGDINRIFVWGKKMDKLQSKIDLHQKDHYKNKKERIKYKNERHQWRKQTCPDAPQGQELDERCSLEDGSGPNYQVRSHSDIPIQGVRTGSNE